jgi:FKBP-type peptidyl-prolyl cis-trans isomerase (trigger factor)
MKNYTTKKINDSTIELEVTISKEAMTKSYETMLNSELTQTKVKGFREGKTPRELVEPAIKAKLLYEVFNRLAPMNLRMAVEEEKIELIATPEFKEIPDLSTDKDVTYKVHCTIMPTFKLGNLKKVKVDAKVEKVTEDEVKEIFKKLEEHKGIKAKKGTKKWVEEASQVLSLTKTDDLEKLTDEVRKTLAVEKEALTLRKAENDALNQAIKLSNIEVPDPAVHFEAHEREHEFNHQLEAMGTDMFKYAEQIGVKVQDLVDGFHKDAKEALETDVFLKLYASDKKMTITDAELEEDIEKVKKTNPQDPTLYDNAEWREYIRKVSLKQRAYAKFLEEVMPKKK